MVANPEKEPRNAENSIGYFLWKKRTDSGYALDDVAGYLKIRKKYLEYIEADDYSLMPGTAYVQGYLKNYAKFLGVEPHMVVRRYMEEQNLTPRRQLRYVPGHPDEESRPPMMLIPLVLVLMLVLAFMWYQHEAQQTPIEVDTIAIPEQYKAYLEPEGKKAEEDVAEETSDGTVEAHAAEAMDDTEKNGKTKSNAVKPASPEATVPAEPSKKTEETLPWLQQ